MTRPKITWISEPNDSPMFHLGPDPRFVAEIGRCAGVVIPLVEGLLLDVAPPDGFILLNSRSPDHSLAACPPERLTDLTSRLVPLDVSRSRIFRSLETLSMPAAVDSSSQLRWRDRERTAPGEEGFYGLREIGAQVGASCDEHGSPRYCYLSSPTREELPQLLVDYLLALHRVRTSG